MKTHIEIERIRDSITNNYKPTDRYGISFDYNGFLVKNKLYHLVDYEEYQHSLPPAKRDNFFIRKVNSNLL
jgi:hypothetical protein